MPRDAIQITFKSHHIDRRPTTALGPAPKPSTHDPSARARAHIQNSNTRWRGWSRAGREPSSIYLFAHQRTRARDGCTHTSTTSDTTTTHRVPPRPDREGRSAGRARSRGRSIARGGVSVCLFTGRDSRTSPRPTVRSHGGPVGPSHPREGSNARSIDDVAGRGVDPRRRVLDRGPAHTDARVRYTHVTFRRVRSTLERTLVTSRTHARTRTRTRIASVSDKHHTAPHHTRET